MNIPSFIVHSFHCTVISGFSDLNPKGGYHMEIPFVRVVGLFPFFFKKIPDWEM